jgi:hypothetical protein
MSKFWVEQPGVLVEDIAFFPTRDMTLAEKLNAITRLVLVAGGVMAARKNKMWCAFLLGALLLIIFAYYHHSRKNNAGPDSVCHPRAGGEGCDVDAPAGEAAADSETTRVEGFSVTPTYVGDDFTQTVVPPLFAEEWDVIPPAYDLVEPNPESTAGFAQPLQPQSYPYGQYLTKTNLLPIDQEAIAVNGCGGARSAREYANGAWLRNQLAFQENITRLHKQRIARRFKHNTANTFSPFQSF